MEKELITVIVPVYNVEKYIHKCIDSIINQTYKNLEIILVDDGSPDNCGKICDEYAKKDSRIKVIHKENGGLSDARNAGIDVAKGEYLCFIDSDDEVTIDYVEYMYNMIVEDNTDMAISEVKKILKKSDIANLEVKEIEHNIYEPEQVFYYMLLAIKGDVCAYAKLYNKKLFDNIRYPKGKVYEDSATTYKIIDKCESISYGNKKCYLYYTRPGSISKKGKFNKNEYDYIENTDEMLKFLKNKYPNLLVAVDRYELYSRMRVLRMMIFTKPRNYKEERKIISRIKSKQVNILKNNNTPKRDKISIIILNLGVPIFKFSWYLYSKLTGRML